MRLVLGMNAIALAALVASPSAAQPGRHPAEFDRQMSISPAGEERFAPAQAALIRAKLEAIEARCKNASTMDARGECVVEGILLAHQRGEFGTKVRVLTSWVRSAR